MAIQDELSDRAKKVILACVREALEGHFTNCPHEIVDELKESEYGVPSVGPLRVCLSEACIDEITHILATDFFN